MLCLLFGKLLRTFLSGGDTRDDVAKRVIQNFDCAYGGRTIAILLGAAQAKQWHMTHDKRTKWVSRLARALRCESVPQPLRVTACSTHTQLTDLQHV